MKWLGRLFTWVSIQSWFQSITALPYTPDQVDFNLNQNQSAITPFDYWGQWQDHEFHPSPKNWRMPFYTIFLDRFANGDPSNDNANGTQWEHDILSNQFRHGGDVLGLVDSFDYLQGMGIKVLQFLSRLRTCAISSIHISYTNTCPGVVPSRCATYKPTVGCRWLLAVGPHSFRSPLWHY